MTTTLKPAQALAAMVAAILAAILASGCGASPHGLGVRTALGQTNAGVVGAYIPATMSQIADGADFEQTMGTLERELFEVCIKNLGFGPRAQAFAYRNLNLIPFQAMSGYTQNQQASVGLVSLQSITQSGMLAPLYIMARPADTTGLSEAELRAVQADQWHCWSKSTAPTRELFRQGAALGRQWYSAEVRLMTTAQVKSATKVFKSCVAHAGAPRTASESLGQFINWLRAVVNRAEFRSRAFGSQPSLQPRRELDAKWSQIFTKCGGPLVLLMQRLLPGAQQAFVQAHFGQLTALEKTAARTISSLEHLTERQF
jgi:hypothetical protein